MDDIQHNEGGFESRMGGMFVALMNFSFLSHQLYSHSELLAARPKFQLCCQELQGSKSQACGIGAKCPSESVGIMTQIEI